MASSSEKLYTVASIIGLVEDEKLDEFCYDGSDDEVFTGELVDTIVEETNCYGQFCVQEKYETWEKITEEEMYAYFGFLILMGMVNLPSIKDYWQKDEVFYYRPISTKISRTRFPDIHCFFTLCQ